MIELKNVYKSYPSQSGPIDALSDINLHVREGEIFGVIGRSGAGKSTLIRCVNLLERPSQGRVLVDGKDLLGLSTRDLRSVRHNIGMVFQHFNLLSSRNVYQNIALPLELLGKSPSDIRKIVPPLIQLVGLEHRADAYPAQLSGGQKQRVSIARALSTSPKVLLCDEMTSALDPETTRSILSLIRSINEEFNLTILLITHEMDVIKSIADHVAVLDGGKIIEKTDVVSLFRKPNTSVAKSFVQSTFKLELPKTLQDKIQKTTIKEGHLLVRLSFVGQSTARPIVDDLVRHHKVRVNILQANIEFLRHQVVGMMVVSLQGSLEEMASAETYLHEQGLEIEELGYVADDDWFNN
jgi:D-methionine transport system ATP-binding protein